MREKLLSVFLIIALASNSFSAEIEEEDQVLVLNTDNFQTAIDSYEFLLVEFYAPWCGHCKKLAPEYVKAAATLRKQTPPLYIAKLDAAEHKDLAKKFGVTGFPVIKLFAKGSPIEYEGERTAEGIITFMNKKTGPPSTQVNSVDEIKTFAQDNEVIIVFLGNNPEQFSIFEKFARTKDRIPFAYCNEQSCVDHYKLDHGNVVLLKKFDEKRNDFTSNLTMEGLEEFTIKYSHRIVCSFDQETAQVIFGDTKPGIFLYRDQNDKNKKDYEAQFTAAANELRGKILFVITGIHEGLEERLAEYIGVKDENLPSVRVHDTSNDLKKFTMAGPITKENIIKFYNDFKENKLKHELKSQDEPETQDGPVYTLVGKTFDRVVMDETKDVLVKFYAPWCSHCKTLAPLYEDLARRVRHSSDIIIAEMDSTENETERVEITGFPVIKFWPRNSKEKPIDYDGGRDNADEFITFLRKHGTVEFQDAKEEL